MAPHHGTGMPFGWLFLVFGNFSWMGRRPRIGVPVASGRFVMQNLHHVGRGTVRGLEGPRGFANPKKVMGAARPNLPAWHSQPSLVP